MFKLQTQYGVYFPSVPSTCSGGIFGSFVKIVSACFPLVANKRICYFIAHLDDEAMFFSPTVVALTSPHLQNHFQILCSVFGLLKMPQC